MLLYYLSFFFVTSLYAQTLDGFLGIEWKTFRQQIKYKMTNVIGVELKTDEDDLLTYNGGTFADNSVYFQSFYFFENRFYHVDVVLDTIDGQDVVIWSKTLTYLEERYGKSDDFQKIDKNQTAIFWEFYDSDGESESLIQLIRTNRGNLESRIQISFTYIPLYLKQNGLE